MNVYFLRHKNLIRVSVNSNDWLHYWMKTVADSDMQRRNKGAAAPGVKKTIHEIFCDVVRPDEAIFAQCIITNIVICLLND